MWNLSGNSFGNHLVVGLTKIFRDVADHGRKRLIVLKRLDRYFVELAIFWNAGLFDKFTLIFKSKSQWAIIY